MMEMMVEVPKIEASLLQAAGVLEQNPKPRQVPRSAHSFM
jgi:hypothetical protein